MLIPLTPCPVSARWPCLLQKGSGGGPPHKFLCPQVLITTPPFASSGLEVTSKEAHCHSPGIIPYNFSIPCSHLCKHYPYETLLNYLI